MGEGRRDPLEAVLDDRELVERLLAGDESAYLLFYQTYRDKIGGQADPTENPWICRLLWALFGVPGGNKRPFQHTSLMSGPV